MKNKINNGHYFELMDRIHIMMGTLHDHMIEHPVSEAHPKVKKRLDNALNILWDTYQIVGELDHKKNKKNEAISKVIFRRRKSPEN